MSEYKTILQCTEELEAALESDKAILNFLNREFFIKPSIYEDVNNPKSLLSASEKAGLLVTGIKNKVKLNPNNYHKLMRYFHQDRGMYGDILDKEYRKQGDVSEEVHPPAEGTSSHLTCKKQNSPSNMRPFTQTETLCTRGPVSTILCWGFHGNCTSHVLLVGPNNFVLYKRLAP